MKWIETDKRFVAFFDIMGFKDLVARNSHDSVLRRMKKIKKIIEPIEEEVNELLSQDENSFTEEQKEKFKQALARPLIFSDSILIVTNSDTEADAEKISLISYWLITRCFKTGIPIKGAISHGKFTADFDSSIYFGQPLIDAYLLQEDLQFYGVVYDHNFEDHIQKKKVDWDSLYLKKYKVNLKSGRVSHYITDWIFALQQFKSATRQIEQLYRSVSGRPRLYVDNTLDCLNHLIDERRREKEREREEKEKRRQERAKKKALREKKKKRKRNNDTAATDADVHSRSGDDQQVLS